MFEFGISSILTIFVFLYPRDYHFSRKKLYRLATPLIDKDESMSPKKPEDKMYFFLTARIIGFKIKNEKIMF
jgi:hypothetical protein